MCIRSILAHISLFFMIFDAIPIYSRYQIITVKFQYFPGCIQTLYKNAAKVKTNHGFLSNAFSRATEGIAQKNSLVLWRLNS